jgi:outer membrane receptor protein involved in Fe transport
MNKTSLHTAIVAALTGYAVTASPTAWSQEAGGLEEIVVTATRREQNLQEVPLAVVAYTGEMLERQGIENMEDLKAVVPNLVVAGNLGGTDTASFTIRGIPNVGTYIDGIWQVSNNGLLLREFVDLQRVEVLRGPQGTLYGEGSVGGTIRFITKNPQLDRFALNADVAALFTEDGMPSQRIEGAVNVPLIANQFGLRIAGAFDHAGGWISQPAADRKDFNNSLARSSSMIWGSPGILMM